MTKRTAAGALALVVGLGADAAETHGAHEHGHAVLRLVQEEVQEGVKVVVLFQSPLDSIVGFEHEPETDEQRVALEEAMRTVQVPENIVRLPATCASDGEPEINVPHVGDDHGDDHDVADEHADADHADHESAGEDGDDHDADEHAEVHADLGATFKYRCESGIEWLEATAFATFGSLEEIELQAVGSEASVVETLTPESQRVALTGL